MFKKNDKFLFMATAVVDVFAILIAILFTVLGIISIVNGAMLDSTETIVVGIIYIPMGVVIAFVFWIFEKVFLSLVCDVKLIRNKLYGENNSGLKSLINSTGAEEELCENSNTGVIPAKTELFNKNTVAMLRELKQLCAEGIISEEEFEQEKSKILKKDELNQTK